jgi:6-phosphogluconolactonase (cycloisomerase 2 family)
MLAVLLVTALFAGSAGSAAADQALQPGAVYVQSNAAAGNEVIAFNRSADGSLTAAGSYATGGMGSGSALGSQGAVTLSDDNRWLFVVNAGSDDVSVFAMRHNRLQLRDTVPSGGDMPISVTARHDRVYVLNGGGSGNISGFSFDSRGDLQPLAGSTQPLSNNGMGAAPGPAQISFSPDGEQLVVTEKMTNQILTYALDDNGVASAPVVHPSAGMTPFGFGFSRQQVLIVSEAFGGAPDASAVSSYLLDAGDLTVVSPSVLTTETAACWIAVTNNHKYAYATNTGSGSVTGYRVEKDSSLTLLDADGQTGLTGAGSMPIDEDLSVNSNYLYVLASGTDAIVWFAVGANGSLTNLGQTPVADGAVGLAAR